MANQCDCVHIVVTDSELTVNIMCQSHRTVAARQQAVRLLWLKAKGKNQKVTVFIAQAMLFQSRIIGSLDSLIKLFKIAKITIACDTDVVVRTNDVA
jgi:hypothetical protein